MKPADSEKVQHLDFVVGGLLVLGEFLQRRPTALERTLIQQAKSGFLLRDLAALENLVDSQIKITGTHFDGSGKLATFLVSRFWLFLHEFVKRLDAFLSQLTQKEVPQPFGFTLENQRCCPGI